MKIIIKKELIEWFNAGSVGRWGRYEFLVTVGLIGVVLPLLQGRDFGGTMLCIMAVALPVMMTSAAMADGIAGERERGTLETLFLLPLSSAALLGGKVFGAVGYALIVSIGALVVGSITLSSRSAPLPPPVFYFSAVFGCLLLGTLFALSISWIALGNVTARQAQTYGFLPIYLLLFLALAIPRIAGSFLHEPSVLAISTSIQSNAIIYAGAVIIVLCVVNVVAFFACVRRFDQRRCAA